MHRSSIIGDKKGRNNNLSKATNALEIKLKQASIYAKTHQTINTNKRSSIRWSMRRGQTNSTRQLSMGEVEHQTIFGKVDSIIYRHVNTNCATVCVGSRTNTSDSFAVQYRCFNHRGIESAIDKAGRNAVDRAKNLIGN